MFIYLNHSVDAETLGNDFVFLVAKSPIFCVMFPIRVTQLFLHSFKYLYLAVERCDRSCSPGAR
jgi:hypothetical protein